MGKLLLAAELKMTVNEASNLIKVFWEKNPELYQFNETLKLAKEIETPLFKRKLKLVGRTKLNWIIQGSCAELLWKALIYLFTESTVKVLPHFHDELVLKCLVCKNHTNKPCQPILKVKSNIENLYPFVWPVRDKQGQEVKVFKLEVK
jgi:DNA polymerase I-like protein with 3'-5' exonuclease and polymerase domains